MKKPGRHEKAVVRVMRGLQKAAQKIIVLFALLIAASPFTVRYAEAGTIIIVKTTVGLDGTFDFTASGSIGNFSVLTLGNTGVATHAGLNAGLYVISETSIQGFRLSSATCVSLGLGSTISVIGGTASIDLGILDTVTCTYVSVSDSSAPTLASFTRQSPAGAVTNADTLVFR
ncbi:MAG: hypothetical protein K2Q28_17540, partial [Hyphomicrobium sp.]|nr:hypothetical protein [Hyphomicrobium sp.]